MEISLYDVATGACGSSVVNVSDNVFGVKFNEALIHQTVVAYLARARQGSKAQKTRAQVAGGGSKPWRQKGTGRARAGSTRGPIWRGGGVTFAATPRSYKQKLNKKMYRGAMRSIVSELLRLERLLVVEQFSVSEPKTKELVKVLAPFNFDKGIIVMGEWDENVYLAARNIPNLDVYDASAVDPVSLVSAEKVLVTVAGLKELEERLG